MDMIMEFCHVLSWGFGSSDARPSGGEGESIKKIQRKELGGSLFLTGSSGFDGSGGGIAGAFGEKFSKFIKYFGSDYALLLTG